MPSKVLKIKKKPKEMIKTPQVLEKVTENHPKTD